MVHGPHPSSHINKPLFLACLMIELVIGIVANTSLIWLVATVQDLRTPPSVLLTNQAVGDLCFLCFSMIPQLITSLVPGYDMPPWLCHVNHFTYFTSFAVSALSLMAISIERYCAIVIPLRFRQVRSLRATSAVCGLIWLLAGSFGAYAVYTTEAALATEDHPGYCTYPYEKFAFHMYFIFQLVFLYIIPVLCMTVFYGICARQLLRKEIRSSSGHHKRVRVAVNLMIITIVFTLCWMPHYVYYSWFLFGYDFIQFGTKSMVIFRSSRVGLYYFASCINPIILYAMSSSFRRHFVRKLTSCAAVTQESQDSSQLSGRTYASTQQTNAVGHVNRQKYGEPNEVQMEKLDKLANRHDPEEREMLFCSKRAIDDHHV